MHILKDIYSRCSTNITIFEDPVNIPIERGVRQGDTISPKLFTAVLEDIIRKLEWEEFGLNIHGRRLNHLRFADDIVLISSTTSEASIMLRQLEEASKNVGLRLNRDKTKAMKNKHADSDVIKLGSNEIEEVSNYVYLGQAMNMEKKLEEEISRRKRAAWNSYSQLKEVFHNLKDRKTRAHLVNSTVLPALLYGSETWAPTKTHLESICITQRAIERRILKISKRDHVSNEELRERSGAEDAGKLQREGKLRWAGHVCRREDGRWTRDTTEWLLTSEKALEAQNLRRRRGRPITRWEDGIKAEFGHAWPQLARERSMWKTLCTEKPL